MYQLVVDESNLEPDKESKFFISGGIFFPEEKRDVLHCRVKQIRRDFGFKAGDSFKFNTHSRTQVSAADRRAAKNEVLQLCLELPIYFVASVRLHELARKLNHKQLVTWGADSVLMNFNGFLRRSGCKGTANFDKLPFEGSGAYLEKRFGDGLVFNDGATVDLSERLVEFAETRDGWSHINSVADIVLGAFRYCVNKRQVTPTTSTLMAYVWRMALWGNEHGNAFDYGLHFLPKDVYVPAYKQEYANLRTHLHRLVDNHKKAA